MVMVGGGLVVDEIVADVCASVEKDCRGGGGGGGVHIGIKNPCELGGYVDLSIQCKSCQLRISDRPIYRNSSDVIC